jgi:hypothetical protein
MLWSKPSERSWVDVVEPARACFVSLPRAQRETARGTGQSPRESASVVAVSSRRRPAPLPRARGDTNRRAITASWSAGLPSAFARDIKGGWHTAREQPDMAGDIPAVSGDPAAICAGRVEKRAEVIRQEAGIAIQAVNLADLAGAGGDVAGAARAYQHVHILTRRRPADLGVNSTRLRGVPPCASALPPDYRFRTRRVMAPADLIGLSARPYSAARSGPEHAAANASATTVARWLTPILA